jgi:PiT family inorganic phosphate transporter
MIWFYLLSGLFLGWSLGANDAANIFGTAVTTQMVKFRVAAVVATLFVVLGAVIAGSGATETLGELGAVNAIAGSFTVALAAGFTVSWMTRLAIPVSTTQAIVGAIIGWNLFTGFPTNIASLAKIVITWIASPIIAGIFSAILYFITRNIIVRLKIHLLRIDAYNRVALILVGAFGAFSLGANNIANVMGVFVPAVPFEEVNLIAGFSLSGTEFLFLLGALAIGIGIYTYSYRVMQTVGNDLFKLTPITALIVVLAESLVLFLFASKSLRYWLMNHGIPPLPLVPLSSSQAVIGAVLGLALAKGARGVQFNVLGKIASGWVVTPVAALLVSFFALFFAQNLFEMQVYHQRTYRISGPVLEEIQSRGISAPDLDRIADSTFTSHDRLRGALESLENITPAEMRDIFQIAQIERFEVDTMKVQASFLSDEQYDALTRFHGQRYEHSWRLRNDLAMVSPSWRIQSDMGNLEQLRIREKFQLITNASRVHFREREK